MEHTVILAHGAYPTHSIPLSILRNAEVLVCTDGAVNDLEEGIEPTWIVGDLDSLQPAIRQKMASRVIHYPDQETNDLTKAVEFCLSKGIRKLTILGATGLREDHTLANFSLLGDYAQMLDHVQIVTDHGRFLGLTKPALLSCRKGEPVSFFAFDPSLRLQVSGVQYPVEQVVFDALWKGTLNVCAGTELDIAFSNGPLAVYFTL